jgi:hypothetical protein
MSCNGILPVVVYVIGSVKRNLINCIQGLTSQHRMHWGYTNYTRWYENVDHICYMCTNCIRAWSENQYKTQMSSWCCWFRCHSNTVVLMRSFTNFNIEFLSVSRGTSYVYNTSHISTPPSTPLRLSGILQIVSLKNRWQHWKYLKIFSSIKWREQKIWEILICHEYFIILF